MSGIYEVRPPEGLIMAVEFSPKLNQYWPKAFLSFDDKNKRWFVEVTVGGAPNEKRVIVIVAAGKNGRALFDYSRKISSEMQHWRGIDTLATDIVECDRVAVRKG